MLKHRVFTALVLLPVILWILMLGPRWSVSILFGICSFLTLREILVLLSPFIQERLAGEVVSTPVSSEKKFFERQTLFQMCTMLIGVFMVVAYCVLPKNALHLIITACLFCGLLIDVFLPESTAKGVGNSLAGTLSLVYGILPWCAMWELYDMGASSTYLLFLLVVVWGSDTGGYFGGRLMGKHKLMPRISPKKTIEGAVFGLLVGGIGGLLVAWSSGWSLGSPSLIIFLSILCAIIAQIGDLFESAQVVCCLDMEVFWIGSTVS